MLFPKNLLVDVKKYEGMLARSFKVIFKKANSKLGLFHFLIRVYTGYT